VIFQSPVCVLLTASVSLFFATLLPVNDVLHPCLLVVDSFAFVVRAICRRWISSRLSRWVSVVNLLRNGFPATCQIRVAVLFCSCPSFASEIGPVTCSQTMNKHVSTQRYAANQARNEETWVCNCQCSRFGFVARQLRGHLCEIYRPIEIWPLYKAVLARSPRDKFINIATLGGPAKEQ